MAADHVFKPGVAVEAAFILTDLHDPLPDILYRCVDRNGMGRRASGIRHHLISGERCLYLRIGRPPALVPRTKEPAIESNPNAHPGADTCQPDRFPRIHSILP
jgi:hypothetical protein